jgi:alanine racemase
VPEDLSVVGYDDSVLMAFTDPALTTIRQPVEDMSDTVARLLVDQLRGRADDGHEYVFRPELIVRDSTARRTGGTRPSRSRVGGAAGSRR